MKTIEILLLCALFLVFYSYIGYGALLLGLVRIKEKFQKKKKYMVPDELPSVTLVITAWNEETTIRQKIENSFALDYPADKITFMYVTDGSTDRTPEFVLQSNRNVLLHVPERRGKIAAVNRAMGHVTSDIVVFSDANCMLNPMAIRHIVKHYNDPTVGCVSGEKRISMPDSSAAVSAGEGLYWKYESALKQLDARLYSAAGAAGELFSIRRFLFKPVEEDTILDDFVISLRIVEKGFRIAYESEAYAVESASDGSREEWKRKVRICAGGFQAMGRLGGLFNMFRYGLFTVQYVSHRVSRWTFAPLALALLIPLNIAAAFGDQAIYKWLLVLQACFYLAALAGWYFEQRGTRKKILFIPFYFTLMNMAVFAGFSRFIRGGQTVVWQRAKRQ